MSGYDPMLSTFSLCPCSRRTAKEEKLYGSYCQECWPIVKEYMTCFVCHKDVQEEKLYVSPVHKVPMCKYCFAHRTDPEIKFAGLIRQYAMPNKGSPPAVSEPNIG